MSAFRTPAPLRYTTDAPRIPALAISNPDADALVRQFESGKPVRLRISEQLARSAAGAFGQCGRRDSRAPTAPARS